MAAEPCQRKTQTYQRSCDWIFDPVRMSYFVTKADIGPAGIQLHRSRHARSSVHAFPDRHSFMNYYTFVCLSHMFWLLLITRLYWVFVEEKAVRTPKLESENRFLVFLYLLLTFWFKCFCSTSLFSVWVSAGEHGQAPAIHEHQLGNFISLTLHFALDIFPLSPVSLSKAVWHLWS